MRGKEKKLESLRDLPYKIVIIAKNTVPHTQKKEGRAHVMCFCHNKKKKKDDRDLTKALLRHFRVSHQI